MLNINFTESKKNHQSNHFPFVHRLVGCENAIGIMTKLQTSLANEETWVDGATEKLTALPTATSALELDVSTTFALHMSAQMHIFLSVTLLLLFLLKFINTIHSIIHPFNFSLKISIYFTRPTFKSVCTLCA